MAQSENEDSQPELPPTKRLKLDESSQASTSSKESSSNESGLLSFCDDLILEILSYLNPVDLLAVSQSCERLRRVVFDRTLWTDVDFRPTCLLDQELKNYIQFFLPSTVQIATRGPWREPEQVERDGEPQLVVTPATSSGEEEPSITIELLENIRKAAPKLKGLILENHIIDSQELSWDKVPATLEHLSLRACHVTKLDFTRSLFFGIDRCLPEIKTLDLSQCRWFQSHSFLALSKCTKLQELRLADCLLSDFVPYVSLGTRFGFKSLTVVDFRRTWVSDREVSCLNKVPSLRELYLESPGGDRGTSMITDLAITAFGATLDEWNQMGFIVVLMPHFEGFMPSPLRVIQMSNYSSVTDTSLRHCASCLKGLSHVNVRGTSVTKEGVVKFMWERPDVKIESDFSQSFLTSKFVPSDTAQTSK